MTSNDAQQVAVFGDVLEVGDLVAAADDEPIRAGSRYILALYVTWMAQNGLSMATLVTLI